VILIPLEEDLSFRGHEWRTFCTDPWSESGDISQNLRSCRKKNFRDLAKYSGFTTQPVVFAPNVMPIRQRAVISDISAWTKEAD